MSTEDTVRNRLLHYTLINIIEEPFFDSLRTNQQLAYQIECRSICYRGVNTVQLLVVSSVACPMVVA